MTISSAIAKALPAAEAARKWRPSTGHVYHLPASHSSTTPPKSQEPKEPKEEKPLLEEPSKSASATAKHDAPSLDRVAEESLLIHLKYGGEYIDEIPITGKPGEFHLSSTGRKPVLPPQGAIPTGISTMSGPPMINTKLDDKKDVKADKTPKSATMPKLKRKKSKMSPSVTPTATPSAS
jgi:mediator of RNA polymerase II transcription subunit 6